MALPTLTKTWQYALNQQILAQGSALATSKRLVRTEKNGLLSFASNPFTVAASCNGTTAGSLAANSGLGDGVDRWAADSDINWNTAGSPKSWAVLRSTAFLTRFEYLLDLSGADANGARRTIYISPNAGFTGGTTTARPTATDEVVVRSDYTFTGGGNNTHKLHQWLDTTGKHYRCVAYSAGAIVTAMLMDNVVVRPTPGWTYPCFAYMGAGATALNYDVLNYTATPLCKGRAPAGLMDIYLTAEGWGNTNCPGVRRLAGANGISGEFLLSPMGVASESTGAEGQHGELSDIWWGITANAEATGYPGSATKLFHQAGDIVLPNNGTVIEVS